MSNLLSEFNASKLPESWVNVRFKRADKKGCWELTGIVPKFEEKLFARLFALGCKRDSFTIHEVFNSLSVTFKCQAGMAAKLAKLFPAEHGTKPLIINKDKGIILSGVTEKAARLALKVGRIEKSWEVQLIGEAFDLVAQECAAITKQEESELQKLQPAQKIKEVLHEYDPKRYALWAPRKGGANKEYPSCPRKQLPYPSRLRSCSLDNAPAIAFSKHTPAIGYYFVPQGPFNFLQNKPLNLLITEDTCIEKIMEVKAVAIEKEQEVNKAA